MLDTVHTEATGSGMPDYFSNEYGYIAACVPPTGGNWSLKQLEGENAQAFMERVGKELSSRGIRKAYAPPVSLMSGKVGRMAELTKRYSLPDAVTVYRSDIYEKRFLAPYDGIVLQPTSGTAFIMSGGGCPIVVLIGKTRGGQLICIVSHVGRESALDKYYWGEAPKQREPFSIIDSMIAAATVCGLTPEQCELRCFFQIPTHCFEHDVNSPTHADKNKKMLELVKMRYPKGDIMPPINGVHCMDMGELVRQQAIGAGIPAKAIFINNRVLSENGPHAFTRRTDSVLASYSNLELLYFP